ncbi:MAG TPA: ABC transporter substrate-binding protein [Candidatus Megaira endosymbiont of Nemacystus decipiens]|nr:ABC transporter substrate-binding protein [Candidatus Megaera endosymbiont of Nemacystus decipiens]
MNKFLQKILSVLLTLTLCSCAKLEDDDIWVVGTSADNPPYEYMDEGVIQGFDIDLINEIGKRLNKEIIIRNMDFHGLLAALSGRNIDVVIAGMSVTEERKKKVDFSEAYIKTNVAFLTEKNNNLKTLEDLKDKKIGSQLGTIWSAIAYELGAKYNFENKTLANNLMLVEELKLGRLDGVVMEEFQANKFAAKNKDFFHFTIKDKSHLSIAIPKDSKFKDEIDRTIREIKADGTMKELQKKHGLI